MRRFLAFVLDREWLSYAQWLAQRPTRWPAAVSTFVSGLLRALRRWVSPAVSPPLYTTSGASSPGLVWTEGRSPSYFFNPEEVREIARQVEDAGLGRERDEVLRMADDVLRGRLVTATGGVVVVDGADGWRATLADREDVFSLHRWAFGKALAKVWAYTGENAYRQAFLDLLDSWRTGFGQSVLGGPAWDSYTVSERIVHLLFADRVFRGGGAAVPELLRLLTDHGAYLEDHLETGTRHNHLINNGRALFQLGLLEGGDDGARRASLGYEILLGELPRQFGRDGVLREQSTHYHLLLTRTYLEFLFLAERNEIPLPHPALASIEAMVRAARWVTRTDGSVPIVGDASPDWPPKHLTGLIALGCSYFGLPVDVPLNEEAFWLRPSTAMTGAAPATEAEPWILEDSRLAGVRGHRVHFCLRGHPGQPVVRHGHVDANAVSLWVAGRELLLDGGNPTYERGPALRHFRGPAAHSTLVVDGVPPSVTGATMRSLMLPEYSAAASTLAIRCSREGVEIRSAHGGFLRIPDPVDALRRARLLGDCTVIIEDYLTASGWHEVEAWFHLAADRVVADGPTGFRLEWEDGSVAGRLQFSGPPSLSASLLRDETSTRRAGWFSPRYGVWSECVTVRACFSFSGRGLLETRFIPF